MLNIIYILVYIKMFLSFYYQLKNNRSHPVHFYVSKTKNHLPIIVFFTALYI
jgi:hypothetical protein